MGCIEKGHDLGKVISAAEAIPKAADCGRLSVCSAPRSWVKAFSEGRWGGASWGLPHTPQLVVKHVLNEWQGKIMSQAPGPMGQPIILSYILTFGNGQGSLTAQIHSFNLRSLRFTVC